MPLIKIMGCVGSKRLGSGSFTRSLSAKTPMELSSEEEGLFVAISFGKVHRITSLISKIDDINIRTAEQATPLIHTCRVTGGELCRHVTRLLLKERSCDVNAQDSSGKTALMFACMSKDNIDVARILVRDRRCDVNVTDSDGCTALMHAVANDNTETVRVLLLTSKSKHRLDINVQNLEGHTAMDMATRAKAKDMCRVLAEDPRTDILTLQHKT